MLRTLLVVMSFSLLVGCQPKQQILCAGYKQYSALTQDEFVKEMAEVKLKYPTVTQFVADYHGLRNALRKCKGVK